MPADVWHLWDWGKKMKLTRWGAGLWVCPAVESTVPLTVTVLLLCLFGALSVILASGQIGSGSLSVRLCVGQTVGRTEWSSHSELLSGPAVKIKAITAVCSHQFIHVMSDCVVMTSCCFDGSHPAVQVECVHKADNAELHYYFLAKG